MRCEQFELRWQQLQDERRPWDSDAHLVAHSLNCERCALQATTGEHMLLGLELSEPPALSADFAASAVAAATGPDQGGSPGNWQTVLACVGLIAAALMWMLTLLPSPSLPTQAQVDPVPAMVVDGPLVEPSNPAADRDVRTLVNGLAEHFPSHEAVRVIQHLDNQVARPITNSFGTAFTAIYRTIPRPNPQDKSAELLMSNAMTNWA